MTIINSLLDTDMYKITMQQAVLHNFPEAQAEYKFILRSEGINLNPYKNKILEEIEHLCSLKFEKDELDYLSSLPFVKKDYIDYLEDFRLKPKGFCFDFNGDHISFRYKGSALQKILFEVPLMAIISEIYLQDKINKEEAYNNGEFKLNEKKKLLENFPFFVKFADFGTRRRYSREWHEKVVEFFVTNCPDNLVGTSNLYLSKKFNIKAIGTMAHEWLMMGMGLDTVPLKNSQKYMLETWVKEYRGDLGIALTDTIGYRAFLADFDKYFAKLYDGVRHDSADPIVWGERIIQHYESLGIDPKTKTAVFSDSLDFRKMIDIADHFQDRIRTSFGIGTNLTNDVGVKPLSMVIKLVRLNGNPVAKISDEPQKAICEDPEFLSYLKKVYGV